MRVLGIDPGYDRLGLAVLSGNVAKQSYDHSECFIPPTKDFLDRLLACGKRVAAVLEEQNPDAVALETLFVTKNQKTAMHVAELRGVIMYEARQKNIPVFEYSPPQVKAATTGYGRSDKEGVARMVRQLIAIPERKMLDDEMDAIAVALTHIVNANDPKHH